MEFGAFALHYWLEFALGVLGTIVTGGFVLIWRRFRSFNNGIKALLRDRIIQAYNHYMEKGFCPIYGLENVHSMYEEYQALGGNGAVKRLMEELEAMPKAPHNG